MIYLIGICERKIELIMKKVNGTVEKFQVDSNLLLNWRYKRCLLKELGYLLNSFVNSFDTLDSGTYCMQIWVSIP